MPNWSEGLAWLAQADALMYEEKRRKKAFI
jgi:hypothetical protein